MRHHFLEGMRAVIFEREDDGKCFRVGIDVGFDAGYDFVEGDFAGDGVAVVDHGGVSFAVRVPAVDFEAFASSVGVVFRDNAKTV